MARIVYRKTGGRAHDIRFVGDDYALAEGEIEAPGDAGELPEANALSDVPDPQVAAAALEARRALALRALQDEQLAAAMARPDAPRAVKDYAQALGR